MSTRSEILIKEQGVYEGKKWKRELKLYHHSDGYPEGVGKFLMEHVYSMLMSSNPSVDDITNYLIKNKEDDTFEITSGKHVDIEYFYEVNITKKQIKCWSAHYNYEWDSDKPARLVKRKECNLMRWAVKDKVEVSYA